MHQLVQWMENPVSKDKMNDWLGCVPGGNAAGAIGAVPTPAPVPEVAPAAPVPEAAPVPSPVPAVPAVQASPVPDVVPAQPKGDPAAVPASSGYQLQSTCLTALAALVAGFMML